MDTTHLFGIPVPSSDEKFIVFVIIHIMISLIAVISGLFAMFSDKKKGMHTTSGAVYYWSMLSSFVTVIILSIMRWPHNIHLLTIGTMAVVFTFTGRRLSRSKPQRWTRFHTLCMGMSYVLLLTGFYVDNGKNLPLWKLLPQWSFYVIPSLVGIPIIIRMYLTHPLNRRV
jgi:hypothetical protein